MDCPVSSYACIDLLYEDVVSISHDVQMPACLGAWHAVPLVGEQLPSGSYATVYLVRAINDGVVATVMQDERVIATVRAPDSAAWECLADTSRTISSSGHVAD